ARPEYSKNLLRSCNNFTLLVSNRVKSLDKVSMEPFTRPSFEAIYRDHYRMVAQLCLGFARGVPELAQDLTQEVFINVWKGLSTFRGQASLRTWIYRVAVNTCLRQTRQVAAQTVSLDQVADALSSPPPPEAMPQQPLYRAIGQLPEADRLIIMMVLEEQPYEEIAAVMGLSSGTLRVRIHRIKQKLKKWLTHVESPT
ncbi:MAG: sigma-70 family RNA polymerase sigma factor, partial [Bacteroidota bacterium]